MLNNAWPYLAVDMFSQKGFWIFYVHHKFSTQATLSLCNPTGSQNTLSLLVIQTLKRSD